MKKTYTTAVQVYCNKPVYLNNLLQLCTVYGQE